jgi:phosphoribosylamine---glycine ligase
MNVLIIGNGGREHALAWKVAQASRIHHVYVAPGNAGTALENKCSNVNIAVDDVPALVQFAADNKIDLTIVGPEAPLVIGVVDAFQAAGLRCFGPSKLCARLEGSKAFTKDFLKANKIPTAAYATFTKDNFDEQWVMNQRAPLVVKADGLAAGKGVIICATQQEAAQAVQDMFAGQFGRAGATVVVEEFLEGEEASFIVMVDGQHILTMATSQDHKRLLDNDQGPNTGGMGAYSPAPVVTQAIHHRIMREVIEPTVQGMINMGTPYTGFLYAGIMVAPDGTPNVLEFNCRFGDPETQPIMMRLDSDLTALCEAALDGKLDQVTANWNPQAALGIVLAAGNYPDTPRKGDVIHGLDAAAKLPGKVFHAGTQLHGNDVITNGGRVLCTVGLGDSVQAAQQQAYALADAIKWNGLQYRRDIGYRAIAREQNK